MKHGKNYQESAKLIDSSKLYDPSEAIALVKETAKAKFDETIEASIRLGVDPRHADQQVRGVVVLPHGTGKKVRILVIASGAKAEEAQAAGADFVGEEYIEKIQKENWFGFDVCIATPDMMAKIGRKVEYRVDKTSICHVPLGKASFDAEKLEENFRTLMEAVIKAKPAAAKGQYLKSIAISSTMGPGIKVNTTKF